MGIFTRAVTPAPSLVAAAAQAPAGLYPNVGGVGATGLASSTPNNLQTIVLADILGDDSWLPLTQAAAMSVPAVMAARNLIAGQISRQPLKAYKEGVELTTQPTWLYRTNGALSPQMRLMLTIDDLIFNGWSLWIVERGSDGYPVDAARVPAERWTFNSHGEVLVDNDTIEADRVVLIPGPIPGGLLSVGGRTIRAAQNLENTRAQRLRSPSAITELNLTVDNLSEEEVIALRDNWVDARRSPNGAVAVTPLGIEVIDHGNVSVELFTESQNAYAVNIAQLLGVSSVLIDAAVASGGASLTYQNLQTQRSWWLDTGFAFWATPITSRFSMDDCTPRGTAIDFDLTNLTAIPQPVTQDLQD